MYQILNISGGQLVCDLGGGGTLRLNDREHETIKDTDMTEYLTHIESLGLVKCKQIEEETTTTVKSSKSKSNNSKEKED